MTHKVSQFAQTTIMWILLEHNEDICGMDDERWYERFPRLDVRGIFNTQVEGFKEAIKNRISPFSLVGFEIGCLFYHDHNAPAQYQTNGEYIVELSTGIIVYGDESVLDALVAVSKLAEMQKDSFCDYVYKEITGEWKFDGKSLFERPFVYNLTHEQLQKSIKMFEEGAAAAAAYK